MLKHVKMQVKALSFKKEAICENDLFSGAKFLSNGLRLLCSDESKFEIILGNHRHCNLYAKEEWDDPTC